MAIVNELIIKIGGSVKGFDDALDQVEKKTANLSERLGQAAKVSGAAFVGLTAAIGLSVSAYAESEAAGNKLAQSLANQGILSDELIESYKKQAAELQNLTGVDDDAIVAGQAVLQNFIGQTKVTKELSQAALDLAAATGMDLNQAFTLIGKSAGTSTNALGRYGVQVDTNATQQEKLAAITEQVSKKFAGQAVAANQGLGSIKGLESAFGNLAETIGENFAPIITAVIKSLTILFQRIADNKALLNLASVMLGVGAALAGAALAVSTLSIALIKLRAVMLAINTVIGLSRAAVIGLAGATGIGLLVVVLGTLAANWDTVWPAMQRVFRAFVENIGKLAGSVKSILVGAFTFDTKTFQKGLDELKSSLAATISDISGEKVALEAKPVKGRSPAGMVGGEDGDGGGKEKKTKETDEQARERISGNVADAVKALASGAEGAASGLAAIAGAVGDVLLPGIGAAVKEIFTILTMSSEKLRAAVSGFIAAVPAVLATVAGNIPVLLESVISGLVPLLDGIFERLPVIVDTLLTGADGLINLLLASVPDIIVAILDGATAVLESILERAPEFVMKLVENLPLMIAFLIDNINTKVIPALIADLPRIITALLIQMPILITAFSLLMPIVAASLTIAILARLPQITQEFTTQFIKSIPMIAEVMGQAFVDAFKQAFEQLKGSFGASVKNVGGGVQSIKDIFGFAQGGMVPGAGFRDMVPALTMPGELIIPRQDVPNVMAGLKQFFGEGKSQQGGETRVVIGFEGREAERFLTARQIESRALGVSLEGSGA